MRLYEKVDGKYKPEDIEHMIEETIAEFRLEGMHLTDEEIEKLRDYAYGRITKAEYKAWALQHAGVTL